MCERKPPPPKLSEQERRLREAVEQRKDRGFRHDRAFVRRVNADPAARRRGGFVYVALTRREAAYIRARDSLTEGRDARRMHRYTQRHRDEFAITSIEDDWPRPAYHQFRVTRNLARHRAALRRFDSRFRIKLVKFSEPELLRIQDRIDDDALEADGIHFVSSSAGSRFDGVRLQVATTRTDAQEVVTRMFGRGIRVSVIGPTPTFETCSRPERYEVEPDGRTLKVHWTDSGSITPRRIEVIETAGTVYLGAVVETGYSQTDDAVPYSLSVTLSQPLGSRAVKTIEFERPVRRR